MKTIKLRFFKVVGGDLDNALQLQRSQQNAYLELLEHFAKSIGAKEFHTSKISGKFAGFIFDKPVAKPADWLVQANGRCFPKRSANPDFWKALEEAGGGSSASSVLQKFGLSIKDQITVDGIEFGAKVTGFYNLGLWWVEVPTRQLDAAPFNGWTPPADWVEVSMFNYLEEWDYHHSREKNL